MDRLTNFKYLPGIVPSYILLFFQFSYIVMLKEFSNSFFKNILPIIFFGGIIIILLAISIVNRSLLNITSNLALFYIYLLFLTGILLITSFFSNDPLFSTIRILFTTLSLGITFSVFYIIQYIYIQKVNWQLFFEWSSLLLLIILIIGQLYIPDWSFGIGGIRFSGGTNPNTIAFFSLYILIQTHINALLSNKWTKLKRIVWLVSFIVIIWTLSRTTILIVLLIYILFSFMHFYRIIISKPLKNNSIFSSKGSLIIRILILASIILVLFFNLNRFKYYELIKKRIFDIENISSRNITWDILLFSFKENPIVGKLGWWGGSRYLSTIHIDSIASSPHNLFIRLLSETGVLGTIAVLALPIALLVLLFVKKAAINKYFGTPIGSYLFYVILSIFIGQFFEDKYLVGIFELGNNIIIWFLCLALTVYHFSIMKLNTFRKEI